VRLVDTVQDSIEADEQVGNGEKPDVVFNEYRGRVKFVCEWVNNWVEDRSWG
jgi:hypothetical protein